MGVGGVFFAAAALLGLHGLVLAMPAVYLALKVLGGLYLASLGVRIWLSAEQPPQAVVPSTGRTTTLKSLVLGFTTQVSNPKTAIVYASVFATFMPATQTLALGLAIIAIVFTIETSWYAFVALALSSERPRAAYLLHKTWLDRTAGGVMVALGTKLAASACRT